MTTLAVQRPPLFRDGRAIHDDEAAMWPELSRDEETCAHIISKDFDVSLAEAMSAALKGLPAIAISSDVVSGAARVAGTRIPVYMVVDAVQHRGSVAGAIQLYPQLSEQQVKDALTFASIVLENSVEHRSKTSD